jgi:hypothetical protein
MVYKQLYLFIFLLLTVSIHSESLNITIRILEKPGDIPLAKTQVIVQSIGVSVATGVDGRARLKVPSKDYYSIKAIIKNNIEVWSREVTYDNQEITLYTISKDSSAIIVSGEKDKLKVSNYTLTQEDIKRLPGAGGDSLKAIQTLPGIVIGLPIGLTPTFVNNATGSALTSNPYSNSERGDFSLRGGGTRNNQYYFDGFPLPYVFHLGNQSSVLNNNLIKSFDIYTGGFSSRFGYATGGIISIEGIDKIDRTKTVLNTNFFLSDAYLQTPIMNGLSFLAGARKNYPNLVYLRAYPQAIPEDAKYADYSDFQVKLFWDINSNHRVTIQSFGSKDLQAYTRTVADFENSERKDSRPPIGLNRNFRTDGARYIFKTNKFRNTLSYSKSAFSEFYEIKVQNPLTAETIFGFNNVTLDQIIFAENKLEGELVEDLLKIETGVQYRERQIDLKAGDLSSTSSQFLNLFDSLVDSSSALRSIFDGDRVRTKEISGYSEFIIKKNGFKINPGIRLDTYNQTGESNLQPRINSSYLFESTKTTFIGSSGVHYNTPTLVQQASKVAGNPNLFMERSEHNAIGLIQEINNLWNIKIEGFKNIFSNIIVSDNFIQDPYSLNNEARTILRRPDDVIRNPIINRNLNYSNSGYGISEGVEIFLRKERDPRSNTGWYGWLSYTNSITNRINNQARLTDDEKRQRSITNGARNLVYQTKAGTNYVNYYDDNQFEYIYNNDKKELYDLDRTHVLNLVFGYKSQDNWQLGFRFRYFSGTPYTPIVSSSRAGAAAGGGNGLTLNFPKYSEAFNSDRFPPYHQLDIRFDKFLPYEWGYMNVYIDLINFYGRRNAIGQNFSNFQVYERNKNPEFVYDSVNSPYIQTVRQGGNIVYLPLINIGMEVKF